MARVEATIVVNRSLEDVCAYMDDPAKDPEWQSYSIETEKTSEGPLGVGTTHRGVAKFLNRSLEWTSVVTGYVLNERRSDEVKLGPLEFTQTVTLEPVEGGTKLTFVMEGEPRGFFRLADPIVIRMLQRDVEGNLARLKDILEAEG